MKKLFNRLRTLLFNFSEAIMYNFEEAKQWVSMGDVLWRCGLNEIFNK